MKIIACLTLVLIASLASAAEPKWEYLVTSPASIVKSVQEPELKAWLKEHRPQAYEKFFGEKKAEEKAKDEKPDLLGSLMELAYAIQDPQVVAIDYYTNAMAEQGWELFSAGDKLWVFRRERAAVKTK